MGSAVIGRLLVASLHQAIAEILPPRLEFYESWLSPKGFRSKRASLAGMRAVFSFLRQEGEAYHAVMQRAGDLAAAWQIQDLSPLRRRWLHALPHWLRLRAATGLARRLVSSSWEQTQASVRWRRGIGTITVEASLFCDVRATVPQALCDFYASAVRGSLHGLGLEAEVRVEQCLARGAGACVIAVAPAGRVRVAPLAGLILTALALLAPVTLYAQNPVPAARERALVMPLENVTREPKLNWLVEGSAILLADGLRGAGVDTMSRDERLRAFDRLQVPQLAALSRATVIRIGELVGAADVVTGSMALDGDALVLKARRIRLQTGRLDAEVVARGALVDLFATFQRLAAGLWPRSPQTPAPEATVAPPAVPLAAFEQYVKGLLAETPAAQIPFLRNALALYPGYDAARIGLWQACSAADEHRAARAVVQSVPESSPYGIEARFLESLSDLRLREWLPAFTVLSALQARAPSAQFLNNLGVVRLRAGALAPEAGRAAWYFSQARTLDPLDADYVFNLGYAYWLDGDVQAAGYWLRAAVGLAPTDAGAHALLAQLLQAGGQVAEAARELALAQRLSAAFETLDLQARAPAAPPQGLERLKEAIEPPRAQRIDAALEMVGQRDQLELAAFYLDRGRRFFEQELDREAESELIRARYLAPYAAEAHLLLGRIYLRGGRLREAMDAFKVSIWSQETSAARVALAEAYLESRDTASARREAERALVLDPNSLHAQKLLERLRRPGAAPV